MTVIERTTPPGEQSDAELISSVRGGDVSAYGDLFARHRDAATRLARQLVSAPDADDLVSEAFAKVLNVLLAGGGPDVAFRAYLLTAVRRLHVDRIRATSRATPTDDLSQFDRGEPFTDTVIAGFEGGAAARAYASLPERWQLVLWHLEVEGQKPAEVAPLLGMSPNSVSALAYRAREGLRQAYLQMHSADVGDADCQWTHDKLGAYVRKGLSRRDAAKVEEHLRSCRKCTALFVELTEVNSAMASVIGPVVLGSASVAYLGTTGSNSILGGFIAALDRAKEVILAQGKVAVGVGAAAGVAGIAAVAAIALNSGTGTTPPVADLPIPGVTTTPSTPTTGPSPTATPTADPDPETGGGVSENPAVFVPRTPTPTRPPFTPLPTPTTPEPEPTTPVTPAPTSPASADMSVDLAFTMKLGLLGDPDSGTLGNLHAKIDGIPEGMTGRVRVEVVGGTLTQIGSGCVPDGAAMVCEVAAWPPTLQFKVSGVPVTATATVTGPENVSDPAMANNRDSMLLGLLG